MAYIWELFEDMNEAVYVTDIDTNELVYLNAHLKKMLGIESEENYLGQKCYKLLQGKQSVCEFCNNSKLEEGKFHAWIHSNPVLQRTVSVKDTLLCVDGRRYRLEIAIDMDEQKMSGEEYLYTRAESILNNCIQKIFTENSPDQTIQSILNYLGNTVSGERTYIFEFFDNKVMSNTYEWCSEGTIPQIDTLCDEPTENLADWWLKAFLRSEQVVIRDLEEVRERYPMTYAALKPQDIHSLIVSPLRDKERLVGFIGVDNPSPEMLPLIQKVLNLIGVLIVTLLKQRDLLHYLENMSFQDALTGVCNRNALFEGYRINRNKVDSVGVIFCDVTGLKALNDSLGHDAGDQLLIDCSNVLREVTDVEHIFRIGGDEFVILIPNCGEAEFWNMSDSLREKIGKSRFHMAMGSVWKDHPTMTLDDLLAEADEIMYQDKQAYYAQTQKKVSSRRLSEHLKHKKENKTEFERFVEHTYCDFESIVQSMTASNSAFFTYFGDMQKDIFYVSDNMRDTFGFQGNIVPGFLKAWESRVPNPEYLEMYRQDLADILQNKRTIHDLRYQVRDIRGNDIWIRCFGILKWNEDKTIPLFFSGRVSCQDSDFIVDPLTNFLRDDAAIRHIAQHKELNDPRTLIGFSLNGFAQINNTKGRAFGNRLIQLVSNRLLREFASVMSFYRLDGLDFLGIVNPGMDSYKNRLVGELREAIESCYQEMKLSLRNSCSFCVIDRNRKLTDPEELLATISMLIKSAQTDPEKPYEEYSVNTVEENRLRADMSMVLADNVAHGMENFYIVVQPVVSAETGRPVGGEALLRWSYRGANISPAVFIPILEKENMIQAVGRWVFEQAVRACRRALAYNPDFYISFNISFNQLSDTGLAEFMKKTLKQFQMEGSHMVAELTETHFDDQPEELFRFVESCREMGMRIALDDFGNGYSSLRMLLQYPSDIVKLDRSLLAELTESKEKLKFIRSIVFACHQFDKTVCVEGVETALECDLVAETKSDTIQGFFYHKPMEVSALYELLSSF